LLVVVAADVDEVAPLLVVPAPDEVVVVVLFPHAVAANAKAKARTRIF
jgi:hypothetical protein